MVLLAVALQSWRAPFPFRRGDYVPHGIAAKISFERVDEKETDRARDRAEEQVPFVFRNDPARLQLLPEEFRAALAEIAQTETLDDVDPAVRRDFGLYAEEDLLDLPTNAQLTYLASDPVKRFNALRQSIDGPNMMMGRQRIEEMVDDFSKFIAPLQAQGVIDLEDVRRQRIGPHQQILVVPESSELEEGRRVLLSQLRLDFQLSEAGALGTSWLSYPSLRPEIHGAVSHWLARRVEPTMHYDQVATKEAIRLARERVPDRMERFIEGDLLVRPRNTIEAEQLSLLEDEYAAAEQVITLGSRIARMSIVFGMILILSVVNGYYIISNEPRLARGLKRLLIYLSAIVLT
ncbi:HD domain-containing protein, partial [Durusdinium trenchii]